MRIRNYRLGDIETLVYIQQQAAQADGTRAMSISGFEVWLAQSEREVEFNVFVITDDDELNEWGQGGTLEGIEGEVIGYTVLQLRQEEYAYHFLCEGTVHPQHRRRGAGYALLVCALNRALLKVTEIEFEQEQKGYPVYFEALLPLRDPVSENLADKCEMQPTDEQLDGMKLYRRTL